MSEQRSRFRPRNLAAIVSLIAFLFLALAVDSLAAVLTNQASVTLAWDKSTSDFATNGITYRVYATNTAFASYSTNAFAGTNTVVTFTNLAAGTWKFHAVSIQANLESTPSNVIFYTVPTNAPAAPGKFALVYLQNENVLTVTNWSDLGLFRARIYIP